MALTKIVILDRDGVINKDTGYVHTIAEFTYLPGALDALRLLKKAKYKVFVASNQSAIARSICTKADVAKLMNFMRVGVKQAGGEITDCAWCPHGPKDNCMRRKPNWGMFLEISSAYGFNLQDAWAIGNSPRDIQAGNRAGCKTILLNKKLKAPKNATPTHGVFPNLLQAVKYILRNQ